jgi:2-C-methyl-D-erythritol 2,4-cyclodiphosphate synthase
MRTKIAATMNISEGKVNIKATTSEGLGFVGEGKGIVAYAIVLLVP